MIKEALGDSEMKQELIASSKRARSKDEVTEKGPENGYKKTKISMSIY